MLGFLSLKQTKYMCDDVKAYSGVLDCISKTAKSEGAMAFMKGWVPAYFRVAPHTVMTLMLVEQFRRAMGMQAL
jgi:hypothetical protein